MSHDYQIFDVFTDTPMAGNPLAVVFDADDLTESVMQSIAAEFNLSETVFFGRPADPANTAAMRIFTPKSELPFAGHPTVGGAVAQALAGAGGAGEIMLELKAGTVRCAVSAADRTGRAAFDAPLVPWLADRSADAALVADALGLAAGDLGFGGLAPVVAASGPEFTVVPVARVETLGRIGLDRSVWARAFGEDMAAAFCVAPDGAGGYRARMFAPFVGIEEDPATGAAAVAFCAVLAAAAGTPGDGETDFTIVQGVEMGRTSRLEVSFQMAGGKLRRVRLAGEAVKLAEGRLLI